MKKIFLIIAVLFLFTSVANSQGSVAAGSINFQDIHLFKSVATQKMMEVEDGPFNKGTKVQQYFGYTRNGLVDGYNQQWLIIPAVKKGNEDLFYIINYGFLKYLEAGSNVIVANSNGSDKQLWVFKPYGGGDTWMIKNWGTGKYLEIPGGSATDGLAFTMNDSTGKNNQQFTHIMYAGQTGPVNIGTAFINITPAYADNKCLDASGANRANDNPVTIKELGTGDINQQWQILPGNSYYEIKPRVGASRKCMEVFGFSMDNGGRVETWDCVSGVNQKWIVIPVAREKGKYIFFNLNSGKCLQVTGGNRTENGSPVSQHSYENLENCKWKLRTAR